MLWESALPDNAEPAEAPVKVIEKSPSADSAAALEAEPWTLLGVCVGVLPFWLPKQLLSAPLQLLWLLNRRDSIVEFSGLALIRGTDRAPPGNCGSLTTITSPSFGMQIGMVFGGGFDDCFGA